MIAKRSSLLLPFLVEVEGKPGPEMRFAPPGSVIGFYRTIGVSVRDDLEITRVVKAEIARDHGILVKIEDFWAPDFQGSDSDIVGCIGDVSQEGVWYKSGHALFGPEDDEDEGEPKPPAA